MRSGGHQYHKDNPLFLSDQARLNFVVKYPHIRILPQKHPFIKPRLKRELIKAGLLLK